jgi:hypothetical protein
MDCLTNGVVSHLRAFQVCSDRGAVSYSQQDIARLGYRPGNELSTLTTIEGGPLKPEAFPRLNLGSGKGIIPANYQPLQIDTAAMRQPYIDRQVRAATLEHQRISAFFGPRPFDAVTTRAQATQTFDGLSGSDFGKRRLFAELDKTARLNERHNQLATTGEATGIVDSAQPTRHLANAERAFFDSATTAEPTVVLDEHPVKG